ncbi:MAG: VCBS repeat-containing protein [Acidimicrobiia bacterium]
MKRASHVFISSTLLAAVLVGVTAAPAAAVDQEVDGTGIVHVGYYPDTPSPGADINALVAALGSGLNRMTFAGYSIDVVFPVFDTPTVLNEVWAAGGTPFVNLFVGNVSTSSIASGEQDSFLESWADKLKLWLDEGAGRSIIIAPLPEMNMAGGKAYQCQLATFKGAYERIVNVIDARLGPAAQERVRWTFAPNVSGGGCGSIGGYYPDPMTVDFTGLAGRAVDPGAVSPLALFSSALADLKDVAASKPILITDTGACATASRPGWISSLFDLLRGDSHVLGLVWFNKVEGCDWQIWNGTVDGAFDTAFDTAVYRSPPIDDWFVPGTTLVVAALADTPDPCPDGATCDSVSVINGSGPTFNNYLRARLFAPRNIFIYGNPGDFPLMGDWNCDTIDTPGMYRQSDGFVYLRNSNSVGNADVQFFLGNPGDVPIVGDWTGDGCDTISVYRPSEQRFFIDEVYEGEAGVVGNYGFVFGNPGDKPFAGDLDGDGIDEVGLHRESTGLVYYRNTLTTGNAESQFIFGDPDDIIEAGDWNGNGTDSVAVYRPLTGVVYLKLTNQQGIADVSFFVGVGMIGLATAPRTPLPPA